METILYEYHLNFPLYFLAYFIFCACVLTFLCLFIKTVRFKNTDDPFVKRFSKVFLSFIVVFSVVSFFTMAISTYNDHSNYTKQLENNEVNIVEGYVENYDPYIKGQHKTESFKINGVYFEFADNSFELGYQKTASKGGVVTNNGQYLKVKYAVNEKGKNIILYIAEIDMSE